MKSVGQSTPEVPLVSMPAAISHSSDGWRQWHLFSKTFSHAGGQEKFSRKASRPPTWERFQEKPVRGVTLSPGSKSLRHPKQVTYGSEVSHLGFACGEVNHPSGLIFRNKTWKSVRNREKPWMADSECRIFALWFRKNHGQCAAPINFNNLTI